MENQVTQQVREGGLTLWEKLMNHPFTVFLIKLSVASVVVMH